MAIKPQSSFANAFLIDMGRRSQLPHTMFAIQDMHNDRQILCIQQFIQRNLGCRLTTERMAAELGMSVRNLIAGSAMPWAKHRLSICRNSEW